MAFPRVNCEHFANIAWNFVNIGNVLNFCICAGMSMNPFVVRVWSRNKFYVRCFFVTRFTNVHEIVHGSFLSSIGVMEPVDITVFGVFGFWFSEFL